MNVRFLLFSILLSTPSVRASQLYFQLENDVMSGEDGNYSNGMILGWESSPSKNSPAEEFGIHNWLQRFLLTQNTAEKAWGLKISQRMWTPNEIEISAPQPDDRPYAGVLMFEQHAALYNSHLAQKSWFSIGMIGPLSGAEQIQKNIHKLLDSSKPLGWPYQIENHAIVELAYEVDYLLMRVPAIKNSQWEVSVFNHNTLGNLRTDINVGLTFRWGIQLEQSFGRLSSHFGHIGNIVNSITPQSFLFYTRIQAAYRFNDLTIAGKLPYDSLVQFNPKQGRVETGISYIFSDVAVSWSYNIYNKEYLSDIKNWHGYGLLQVSWRI